MEHVTNGLLAFAYLAVFVVVCYLIIAVTDWLLRPREKKK